MSQEFEKIVLEKLNTMDKKLDEHTGILNEHTKKLDEHTGILNEHTKKLDEHTGILNEHTKKLDEHTGILNEHTKKLDEHTGILNDHMKILDEHTEQFKNIRKDIYEVNKKIIKSAQKMEEIEDIAKYNTEYIKKYNEESAKKFDISLKAYEQLNSKVDMSKSLITVLRSKNFENDVRITALEDAIKQRGLIA